MRTGLAGHHRGQGSGLGPEPCQRLRGGTAGTIRSSGSRGAAGFPDYMTAMRAQEDPRRSAFQARSSTTAGTRSRSCPRKGTASTSTSRCHIRGRHRPGEEVIDTCKLKAGSSARTPGPTASASTSTGTWSWPIGRNTLPLEYPWKSRPGSLSSRGIIEPVTPGQKTAGSPLSPPAWVSRSTNASSGKRNTLFSAHGDGPEDQGDQGKGTAGRARSQEAQRKRLSLLKR